MSFRSSSQRPQVTTTGRQSFGQSTSFALRSTGGIAAQRTPSQSGIPASPSRRVPSSGAIYRNSSDGVSAILGSSGTSSSSLVSPSRPRTRGISTPVTNSRPASGFNPALTAPTAGGANMAGFSLPYETKARLSSGKTTLRPIQISSGLGYLQGFRPTMEDNHFSIINGSMVDGDPVSLFAILDGHCGKRVADLGGKVLPDAFFSNPNLGKNNALAFVESVVQTDRTIFNTMGKTDGGSTLISACIFKRMCFVACLGDARAVLYEAGGVTEAMSEDHKPQDPKEAQRIIRCGGSVQMGRVCGCLAVSRALGDFEFKFTGQRFIPNKELMVSNVADVKQSNITDQSRFLLLACDGLWDVMTNEEATGFVVDYLKAIEPPRITSVTANNVAHPKGIPSASYELQRHLDACALRLSDLAIEKGSMDNVSVMIIAFHVDLIADLRADAMVRERISSVSGGGGSVGGLGGGTNGVMGGYSSQIGSGYTPLRSMPVQGQSSPQAFGRSPYYR